MWWPLSTALLAAALFGCAGGGGAPERDPYPTQRALWSRYRAVTPPPPDPEAPCRRAIALAIRLAGSRPTLSAEVHAALAEAEPLVVAGLASPRWQGEWSDYVGLLLRWYPPDFGALPGERAFMAMRALEWQLLERDRVVAATHRTRDAMGRCAAAGTSCRACFADEEFGGGPHTDGWDLPQYNPARQLRAIDASPPHAASRVLPFWRAWMLPPADALAALDALAAPGASDETARAALLLGARATLGFGDVDGAVLRLRRLRALAPRGAPDASTERLAAICRLLGRDPAVPAPALPTQRRPAR